MTTIATIGLPLADSWTISVGGGWIALMLLAMALCFVGMFAFMWLMRDGHGWAMCGDRWLQDTTRRDAITGPTMTSPDAGASPSESEVPR